MENCYEQSPQGSQDWYPHYNLFQSSIFYDTDNFRVSYLSYKYDGLPSERSVSAERSAEPPDKPPEPPETPPVTPKRVITMGDLYRDPEQFKSKFDEGQTTSNGIIDIPAQPWGYDWTKQSWVKEQAPLVDIAERPRRVEPKGQGHRLNCSKAESMMQKMGWQGGALGMSGEGITQPITPDTVYAFRSNVGFGQRTKPPKKPPSKPAAPPAGRRSGHRDAFRTNVLLLILDFVQDDTEIELIFDTSLRQYERRYIALIVNTVVNDYQVHALGSSAQYELAADIHRHNKYVLDVVRQGEGETRQLIIYKEPPDDVYLVTPDDFLPKDDITESDEADDIESECNDKKESKTENGMELDDDENPFLKSIKKSIKKDEEPAISNKFETDCTVKDNGSKDVMREEQSPVSADDKIMEFFMEFAESETFKKLRFLGKFTDEQLAAINSLLNRVSLWSGRVGAHCAGHAPAARAARAAACALREGVNGTTEIYKVPANSRAKD